MSYCINRAVSIISDPFPLFKQFVKKVGQENAEAMLKGAEQGFKENYALLKKLAEIS